MARFKNTYRVESARLPGWDYRHAGGYFITICTQNRAHYFGDIVDCEMRLSSIGQIAYQYLAEIPQHVPSALVDAFIVMPNHVHAILVIMESPVAVETLQCTLPTTTDGNVETLQCNVSTTMSSISPKPGSVSAIIRSYKVAVTRWCRQNKHQDFAWQSRFHDHIIRDQDSLGRIRAYIRGNPAKWQEDCYYAP